MGNGLRRAIAIAAMAVVVAIGCDRSDEQTKVGTGSGQTTGAVLRADPNPVPLGTGKGPASTKLIWGGGGGAFNQIYVSVDGGPEKLVAQGGPGELTLDWIYPSAVYEFKMYEGKEHQKVLGSVRVTRQ